VPAFYLPLPSGTVHTLDLGRGAPEILAVHGLGGSAYNWVPLAHRLGRTIRAIDLPGFGYSPPLRRHNLETFAAVVTETIEDIGRPLTLLGNSMGGLVAMKVAAGRPDLVARLILIAPATRPAGRLVPASPRVPIRLLAQSIPMVGEELTRLIQLRMTPRQQVAATFDLICSDPGRITAEVMEQATEVATRRRHYPWAVRAFRESIGSVSGALVPRATFDAMTAAITCPTLLVYGGRDPVVDPGWLKELGGRHQEWSTVEIDDVGHVPMLELPVTTATLLAGWLEEKA
jgi:pimeloyl-ACP methyl ester carboxylesterase